MSLSYKSRSLDNVVHSGQCFFVQKNPGIVTRQRGPIAIKTKGWQSTASEGHERGRDGQYHEGGPFYTVRTERKYGGSPYSARFKVDAEGNERFHTGNAYTPLPPTYSGGEANYDDRDWSDLDELGTTAISEVAPTNPASNLATLLGEVKKDGIPSIPGILTWKKRTEIAKAAGSEYLNYQFGWRPLVEEVLSVGSAARHSRDLIHQHRRDEGRNVRRGFDFGTDTSTTEKTAGVNQHALLFSEDSSGGNIDGLFQSSGTGNLLTTREEISSRKWFSGAFTYALPSRTDSFRRMLGYGSEADKLFGITITPEVLWELTPWSWAVDWFTNAGDVISNVTQFGLAGLVMRYGYMMEEHSLIRTNTLSRMALKGQEASACAPSTSQQISKARRPANPFGFGFTGVDLSPTQVAITIALGLTRFL